MARHQGCMLATTGKNGNNGMIFNQRLLNCVIFVAFSNTAIMVVVCIMTE